MRLQTSQVYPKGQLDDVGVLVLNRIIVSVHISLLVLSWVREVD